MWPFADYRREHINAIGSKGKVGDLVVNDIETDGELSKFELPALFLITAAQSKPGELYVKYTLRHQLTGETLGPVTGTCLYRAEEYFRVKAAYHRYVERSLTQQLKRQKDHVKLLKDVLIGRDVVVVITEDERLKLKALIEKSA